MISWFVSRLLGNQVAKKISKGTEPVAVFLREHETVRWLVILLTAGVFASFLAALQFSDPQDKGKALYKRALSYLEARSLRKAETYFHKAFEADPSNGGYLWQLAILQTWNGAYEDAIASYEKLKSFFPKTPLVNLQQGEAYEALGDLEKAKSLYEEALSFNGDYTKSYLLLANVLLKKGDRLGAETMVREGLARNAMDEQLQAFARKLSLNLTHPKQ
ncbi:MAG: tetratricopeptide repeat protein [Candidatus Wildermuthbacteria bacterium]|nr:tetratricopeptide repeat protein [Candidatus Wildermuthbacteria bacterium]